MKFKEFMKRAGMVKESLDNDWGVNEIKDDHGPEDELAKQEVMDKTGKYGEPKKIAVPTFKEGDDLILIDNKRSSKIPEDAWDFLMTYKVFKVERVSDTGKLDLGCHISKNTPEGGVEKTYLFSAKRFALKNASDGGNVD
jgi:hypothetical protein